jgi:microcystin-dependent protein
MPGEPEVGSIIAYGGRIDANWEALSGWLLCDGRSLPVNAYPGLFNAIQFAWGGDSKTGNFNIPNLQGYFLRGVDPSRDRLVDKDSDLRIMSHPGGNWGNRVGSLQ